MIFLRMIPPLDTERTARTTIWQQFWGISTLHCMSSSTRFLERMRPAPVFRLHLNNSWFSIYREKVLQNHQLTFLEEYVKLSPTPPPPLESLLYWLEYYPLPLCCSSICYILTQWGGALCNCVLYLPAITSSIRVSNNPPQSNPWLPKLAVSYCQHNQPYFCISKRPYITASIRP